MIRVLVAAWALLLTSAAHAQTSGRNVGSPKVLYDMVGKYSGNYVCIVEAAGGVSYYAAIKSWQGTRFKADNKYILRIKKGDFFFSPYTNERILSFKVHVNRLGERPQPCRGTESFDPAITSTGFLRCTSFLDSWVLNLSLMRFSRYYLWGYVGGTDEGGDTPVVEIGKCSRID